MTELTRVYESLNRKRIFFTSSVFSLQFLQLLSSLPVSLMSCELSFCFKLKYTIKVLELFFFQEWKRGAKQNEICQVVITNQSPCGSLISQKVTSLIETTAVLLGGSCCVWDHRELSLDGLWGWASVMVISCKKTQSDLISQELTIFYFRLAARLHCGFSESEELAVQVGKAGR